MVGIFLTVWKADDRLIAAPSNLSFAEMAGLAAAGGTAANTLFYSPLPFQKGSTVVTQGTGGVSVFAIQVSQPHHTLTYLLAHESLPVC